MCGALKQSPHIHAGGDVALQRASSFAHLVRLEEEPWGDRQVKRLGDLEGDDPRESRRLRRLSPPAVKQWSYPLSFGAPPEPCCL
jgi:hypothetical protein